MIAASLHWGGCVILLPQDNSPIRYWVLRLYVFNLETAQVAWWIFFVPESSSKASKSMIFGILLMKYQKFDNVIKGITALAWPKTTLLTVSELFIHTYICTYVGYFQSCKFIYPAHMHTASKYSQNMHSYVLWLWNDFLQSACKRSLNGHIGCALHGGTVERRHHSRREAY